MTYVAYNLLFDVLMSTHNLEKSLPKSQPTRADQVASSMLFSNANKFA